MSDRTARKWERGPLPSETKSARTWRTREDPFEDVWESDVMPLLRHDKAGELQAKTIFEELQDRHPDCFKPGQLRTLQRRIRDWRAAHGPTQEVYFEQEHPPGREAAVDFTHATELGVSIGGEPFAHLLFALKLSFSGWTWVCLAQSETYEAFARGIQGALWELGGVLEVLRSDNLSAATRELRKSGGRELTERYRGLLEHYDMRSTRIRPGKANENGVVEKSHDLVKTALDQALLLRGHRDFASVEEYESFVREVVARGNRRREARVCVERQHLRPLPPSQVPNFTTYEVKVKRWSTMRVSNRTYSVPSRLIGHQVEARVYPEQLEVLYRGQLIETLPRLSGDRTVRIDYRHVIWSLVRKPGAFARYRYREELFPSLTFRRAYDALCKFRGERADVEYVRILHLAASTLEGPVERALAGLLESGERFDYAKLKDLVKPEPVVVPQLRLSPPDLRVYDKLIGSAA